MCTLIVFNRVIPNLPLVVAANRDESPTRPTAPPGWLDDRVFAPQDLVFGGSWLGVNRDGLLVGITNNYPAGHVRGRRSRGHLVTEALACSSVDEAGWRTMGWPDDTYNGFHLVIADANGAILIRNNGHRSFPLELSSGVHVVTGDGFGPGHSPRVDIVEASLCDGILGNQALSASLRGLLCLHGPGPEDGTCVHGEGVTNETILSTVVWRHRDCWDFDWRVGRPCEGPMWHAERIDIGESRKEERKS